VILPERETLLENGTNTKYRPAMVISDVSLGPFCEMGSLAT